MFNDEQFESKIRTILLPEQLEENIELQLEVIYATVKVNYELNYSSGIHFRSSVSSKSLSLHLQNFSYLLAGFLLHVFNKLENSQIVHQDAFIRWSNNENSYVTGNRMAVHLAKHFINRLKKDETLESDDFMSALEQSDDLEGNRTEESSVDLYYSF